MEVSKEGIAERHRIYSGIEELSDSLFLQKELSLANAPHSE